MKIWQHYNKRTKRNEWRARFELNNKTYRVAEDTKDDLLDTIAEIRRQEKTERDNKKFNLNREVVNYEPTVSELLLDEVLPKITNPKQKQTARHAFEDFLSVLPAGLKVRELTTYHFQNYIHFRKNQISEQTGEVLKPQTVNKGAYTISAALRKAPEYFEELENWTRPRIPYLPEEDSARELNLDIEDFHLLLQTLRKPREGKQTIYTEIHRRRLADDLEFRYETGLRRKEVARLQRKQYIASEGILKNVRRWKTKTTTKIFPLTERAIEIIESRLALETDSPYIFTSNGNPVESDYRTLKNVCAELGVAYGRFDEGGFVPHDLRHQAGTEIVRVADIETAREYLGHSNVKQTTAYLHTNAERLKEAVKRRDEVKRAKADTEKELKNIFQKVKNGEITEEMFIEKMRKFVGF